MIGLIAVSSVQMFVVLSIIQLALPETTTIIYEKVNGTTVDFCSQPENRGDDRCFAQGPLTIYRALDLCPLLLVNGLLNIVYYLGEASMYRQPLGVLMLVLAALTSSFIIAPLQEWFSLDGAKQVSGAAIALGVFGAVCCLVERTPPSPPPVFVSDRMTDDEPVPSSASLRIQGLVESDEDISSSAGGDSLPRFSSAAAETAPLNSTDNHRSSFGSRGDSLSNGKNSRSSGRPTKVNVPCWTPRVRAVWARAKTILPLFGPFLMLSFAYALYFVIMLLYNDRCKINMWGYNAYDQVTFPVYMFAVFFMVDSISVCKRNIRWDERQDESMIESCKVCFKELTDNRCAGLVNMFVYRLLINARAVAYTYITVQYNLSSSYLELTLIRVVLSWMASLVLVLLLPAFIQSEQLEQQKLKDWLNLLLKVVGTCAIVGSLIIIHYE